MSDETKVQISTNAEETTSSQPIAKPNVGCSLSDVSTGTKPKEIETKAKDFLWQNLDAKSRNFVCHLVEKNEQSKDKLVFTELVSVGFDTVLRR